MDDTKIMLAGLQSRVATLEALVLSRGEQEMRQAVEDLRPLAEKLKEIDFNGSIQFDPQHAKLWHRAFVILGMTWSEPPKPDIPPRTDPEPKFSGG